MQTKVFFTKLLSVIALIVCVLSAIFLLYFIFKNEKESISMPSFENFSSLFQKGEADLPAVNQSGFLLPSRLKIPSINIDAVVEHVGLTSSGAVDVPKGPDNVAWFNSSPRPGEVGSAIVDGHSGYKNDRPAVFDNLHKLKKGDKIYIENEKGGTYVFVVRKFKSYGNSENVSDVFSSDDGKAHLNLITCSGDWNAIEKTHSKRLVVFTDEIVE